MRRDARNDEDFDEGAGVGKYLSLMTLLERHSHCFTFLHQPSKIYVANKAWSQVIIQANDTSDMAAFYKIYHCLTSGLQALATRNHRATSTCSLLVVLDLHSVYMPPISIMRWP